MSKVFLDTNVLVYAMDQDSPGKCTVARDLMRVDGQSRQGLCISTQVLQEFYVAATRKLKVEPLKARRVMESFRGMETVVLDREDILKAIDGNILWQVSFWDALVLVAARKARCPVIYSEDLNHGQSYGGVKVLNPFLNRVTEH